MDFISEETVVISGKVRGKKKTAEKQLLEKRIQYATRGKKRFYCEPEVPDDDHYICEWNNCHFPILFVSPSVFWFYTTCESWTQVNTVHLLK